MTASYFIIWLYFMYGIYLSSTLMFLLLILVVVSFNSRYHLPFVHIFKCILSTVGCFVRHFCQNLFQFLHICYCFFRLCLCWRVSVFYCVCPFNLMRIYVQTEETTIFGQTNEKETAKNKKKKTNGMLKK